MLTDWRTALTSTTARFIGLVFVLQLAATSSIFYYFRQSSATAQRDDQQMLVGELRSDLVAGFQESGRGGLTDLIDARLREVRTESPVILLTAPDGKPLAGNLGAWPATVHARTPWQVLDLYRSRSTKPETIGLIAGNLANGDRLLTGHVIQSALRQRQIDEDAMIAALVLAIPLALLIAAIAARIVAQRVEAIATTASAVASGDLSYRVPPSGGNDAFAHLGDAINAMLARIDTLVGELRVVTDGLAHDLRSPITRLKSTLERAIIGTDDPDALAALQSVSREAETLLAMLTTALQISRAEAGIGRDRFFETDVRALLTDLVEVYGPYAEDKGFAMTAEGPEDCFVPLHRELMSQAIGNLIENAIKYANGGTMIALGASRKSNVLMVSVADNGPGIPAERRDEARKRFGRLDPARHISGSGLGMSLVEAVARLHGGTLELEDNDPGLCVTLAFPS
jgi:signal transduction histidine kinase